MSRTKGSRNRPKNTNGDSAAPAHGNGFDPEFVSSYVKRIESLHAEMEIIMAKAKEECEPLREDIAEVYEEAERVNWIPKRALKSVLRARALERKAEGVRDKLEGEEQETYDQIRHALGDLAETPLGQAAMDTFTESRSEYDSAP